MDPFNTMMFGMFMGGQPNPMNAQNNPNAIMEGMGFGGPFLPQQMGMMQPSLFNPFAAPMAPAPVVVNQQSHAAPMAPAPVVINQQSHAAPMAPAPVVVNQQSHSAPSAAAGSESQLLAQQKNTELKRSPQDEELANPKKKSKNFVEEEEEEEEDSIENAQANFKAFMDKLKSRKGKTDKTKEEVDESDAFLTDDEEEDIFVNKPKGKKKCGRPKGRANSAPLKEELQRIAKDQLQKLKTLKTREKALKKENGQLKLRLKTKEQAGDSDVIVLSSDNETLPMTFSSNKKEEEYDWTGEEAAGTFNIPEDEDDYGYNYWDETSNQVTDLPFLHKSSLIDGQESLKNACKACKVAEVTFQILPCKHIGLCENCMLYYMTDELCRCPGCGTFHVLTVEKVFF